MSTAITAGGVSLSCRVESFWHQVYAVAPVGDAFRPRVPPILRGRKDVGCGRDDEVDGPLVGQCADRRC
eukprot:11192996-Lingulodinium_polyedra.AAC.1